MMYFTALGSLEPSPATLLPLVRPSVQRLRRRGGRARRRGGGGECERALHGGAGYFNNGPKRPRSRGLRPNPLTLCAPSGATFAAFIVLFGRREKTVAEPPCRTATQKGV